MSLKCLSFPRNNKVCSHIRFLHVNKFPAPHESCFIIYMQQQILFTYMILAWKEVPKLQGRFNAITRLVNICDCCIQKVPELQGSFSAITRLVDICDSCIQKSSRTTAKFQCNNQVSCSFAHKILISNSQPLIILFYDQLRLDAPYTF